VLRDLSGVSADGSAAAEITLPPPRVEPYRGPPPHEKGPPVFLDYDQVELDAAYEQQVYQPNIVQVGKRWASNSARTRARIGEPQRRAYGPTEIERLDIFRTDSDGAPVFVFIHGGAWTRGKAADYHAPAEMFVRAGAHYVTPDFARVQDVGGSLFPMADQVCRAIAWVARNAASFGGDPERIYVGGQSSGAHLTAVALTTDWIGEYGLPADPIQGGLCASGMYELAPVRLSARNNYVKFTDDMVEQLSPIRHLDRLQTPVIVSYATYETPEFQRQAREFAAALQAAGKPVELVVGDNYSHTELLETLCNPYGHLGAAILARMGLAPP
jgi:arylformamidase